MKHADSQSPDHQSPVSFVANVAKLPQKGLPVVIEADAAQRAALAGEHELLSVENYRAELLVAPWKRNGVKVSGRVEADITQACVVTLDPVEAHIDEAVDALFLPEQSKLGRQGFEGGGEIMLDAEGPDSPETFSGNTIDVGALAEQFFGLAIDPYPRKQGVSMEAADDAGTAESQFQQKLRSLLGKS
ncbi:YceD family protein [Mesorhizobium sp. BHbdii]